MSALAWLLAAALVAALACGTTGQEVPQASGRLERGTSLVPRSVGGGDVFGAA